MVLNAAPTLIMVAVLSMARAAPPVPVRTASAQSGRSATAPPPEASGSAYYEFLLAHHLERQGDVDGAVAAYRRAAALDPTSAAAPAELAALYARMNQARDAITAAEAALKVEPDFPDAHRVLGMVYASLAQNAGEGDREYLPKAIKHLEQAQGAGPRTSDSGADVMLARLYLRARQPEKAIERLSPMVASDPDDTETMFLLVQAYADSGRSAEAESLVKKLAEVEPTYYRVLGELYERDGRWTDAADAYASAVEATPGSAELKMRWATALLNSPTDAHAAKALEVMKQVTTDAPADPRALYLFSQAQRRTKDLAGAETTARRMMTIDPRGTWGPYALAQVLEDRKEYARIVEVLEPVTTRFSSSTTKGDRPDVARLFAHLALAYQETKQPDRAIATLEAGGRFSNDATMPFQLGAMYEQQKRYADAERAFRQALDRDPRHAPTLNYLGYMLAERGERLDESVGYIRRALDLEPDNPSYLDSLGWAYYQLDQLDRAEPNLRRASEMLRTNSTVQDHWGDLLFKLGRFQEAITAWELALSGDGEGTEPPLIQTKIKSARSRLK